VTDGQKKGRDFENVVCRELSAWVVSSKCRNYPVYELPFRRRFTDSTPIDGHWEGAGDILHQPGIVFPFCVECKKVEGWELDGLLSGGKWPVWSWWSQACEQAAKTELIPLLVFTRNRRKIYTMMPKGVESCLSLLPSEGAVLRVETPKRNRVVLARLDDLVATNPKRLKSLAVDYAALI